MEDWIEYIERLQFYFDANGISDAVKQSSITELLWTFNVPTTTGVQSLVLPTPLTVLSFKDLMAKMKAEREPKPSVIVECYQFNSRQRVMSETVAEYVYSCAPQTSCTL